MKFDNNTRQISIQISSDIEFKDYVLEVTLEDNHGGKSTYSLTVSIVDNRPK